MVAAELIELLPTMARVSTTMEVFEAVALDQISPLMVWVVLPSIFPAVLLLEGCQIAIPDRRRLSAQAR